MLSWTLSYRRTQCEGRFKTFIYLVDLWCSIYARKNLFNFDIMVLKFNPNLIVVSDSGISGSSYSLNLFIYLNLVSLANMLRKKTSYSLPCLYIWPVDFCCMFCRLRDENDHIIEHTEVPFLQSLVYVLSKLSFYFAFFLFFYSFL